MGNLTIATIFIVTLNLLMWFGGLAMININPSGPAGGFCDTFTGSIIDNALSSGVANNSVMDQLPTASTTTISPGSTSFTFTNIFNNILSWFKSTPGIKYIYGVVAAPTNILGCLGFLPSEFRVGIGVLWYLVSFLVLIAFLWGRD